MTATLLEQLWQEGEMPLVNGVVFRDGRIVSFGIAEVQGKRVIGPLSRISLADFMADAEPSVSNVDTLAEITLSNCGEAAKAVCGEGSWGGDGFVAVFDRAGQIVWAAVFDCSNPFEQVEQCGDELVARSNLGERWAFPLSAPERFRVLDEAAG